MEKFKKLIEQFTKLPGVGPRQAIRFALSLLDYSKEELENFARLIFNFKDEVKLCKDCFNVASEEKCSICLAPKREQNKIMIVEKITDLESIERSGQYKGLYHVLGGAINPPDGVMAGNLKIKELIQKISNLVAKDYKEIEIILATNPTTYGDTTSLYIAEELKKIPNIKIKTTKLARGLSSQTSLEYADEITLKNALTHRK